MSSQTRSTTSRRESVNASLLNKVEEKQKCKDKANGKQTCPISGSDTTGLDMKFDVFRNEVKEMFAKFDESFDKKISAFEKRLSGTFKELKDEIKSMQTEMNETKAEVKELKTKMQEMEHSVEFHSKVVEEEASRAEALFNKRRSQLELEMSEIRNKMLWQEKHDRQYNLLFYGFTETEGEDLEKVMKTFFKDKLDLEAESVDNMVFANFHRLPSDSEAPKPVIIKFQKMRDRDLVFSQAFKPVLRAEKKRILTDLPVAMKKERGRLAKAAYEIRKNEVFKTRIIEKGLNVFLEVRKDSKSEWVRRDI